MMYKLKFRHKLKLALNQYKRAIILLVAFLVTSAIMLAVFGSNQMMAIPGLYDIDSASLVIGLGGLIVICLLVYLD
ncbi:MAG TPA: hypothetical protein VIM93_01760 [Kangiella sp.]